ncbi:MAG TPA: ribose 5-phosphate isomerase B [Gemmatimonadota bacterium]|nr:ribose 5-phosphate isomerase B [Gemmatimonadota bacterium]
MVRTGTIGRRTILLAADHAGYELKSELTAHVADLGYKPLDMGTNSTDPVDYPDFAGRLAQAIAAGRAPRGVLICGAGIGMSIAANRYAGVRAANCLTEQMAALAREHNDANVLCLGSRLLEPADAKKILWTFLDTDFGAGRHQRRVEKIERAEARSSGAHGMFAR